MSHQDGTIAFQEWQSVAHRQQEKYVGLVPVLALGLGRQPADLARRTVDFLAVLWVRERLYGKRVT